MRSRELLFFLTTAFTIVGFLYLYGYSDAMDEADDADSKNKIIKVVRYGFSVTNTTGDTIRDAKIITFSPLPLTSTQKVISLHSNHSYQVMDDAKGNRSLEFNLPVLAPYASKSILITVTVSLADWPDDIVLQADQKNLFLSSEKYIELDSPHVSKVSNLFENGADKEKRIFEWLVKNVKDSGYIAEDRGAAYALKYRKGDCTEYMYSFVALARGQEIPSRSLAGFWLEDSANVLSAGNYHNWAEYYDGKRWILVDPQRQVFNEGYLNYIAFRHINRQDENTYGNSERFMAFDPRLRISMN